MTTNTKTGPNGNTGGFPGLDIAAILADPSGSQLDDLYEWMDAVEADLGGTDPRVARHNEVFDAAITGLADLVRISPHDEMERMIAAQLVAAHAATMDCYRRSRTSDVDKRRENLNQANKLSRAFVMLLGALDRNRGKVDERVAARLVPSGGHSPSRPEARAKVPSHDASGPAETGAADKKSEKQPHAKPTAPPLAPVPPGAPPAKAASVSAPGANAKTEEQPHAKPIAPSVKPASDLSAAVRALRMADEALARRRKSEE